LVETIICGVDSSVGAREALRIAVDLGDRFGYRVVAVHVVQREEADGERDIGAATLRARGRAERVLAEVLDDEGLVGTIEWRAEVGETTERLAAVAEEERAALIVLGSQTTAASAGLRGWLANEVARRTAVPVAVPAERGIVGGRDVGRGESTGKAA
jgi:nucleotide-binding universal stress UspA family protein